ncbi:MAG: hypothetical protein ACRBBN_05825 [Methyloligellaceae bacterium]
MIYGISIILLSLIAVPSLVLARRPDAKEILDKIAPFQGWIGVVFCFWGIWGIIQSVLYLSLLATAPIAWATMIACSVVIAALGFLLGYGLIAKFILSGNAEAKAKGDQLLQKLAPLQGTLGIAGIGIGIWAIITSVL